jgi:hypothetical protein
MNSAPLSIRTAFGGPPRVANTFSSSATRRSLVVERSTRCSTEPRACSSIIEAIFTVVPSTGESNWKSVAHTTFGASASIGRIEEMPAR